MYRLPVAKGRFYPEDKFELQEFIENFLEKKGKRKAKGVIVPDGEYFFTAELLGKVYSQIELPSTAVLIGSAHTRKDRIFAIWGKGAWVTPLGKVEVDEDFVNGVLSYSQALMIDESIHKEEHCLEVQLPFLQILNPQIKIVPIVVSPADYAVYVDISDAISQTIKDFGGEVLTIISADLVEYGSREEVEEKDLLVLESLKNLDEFDLLEKIHNYQIYLPGCAPLVVGMIVAKNLGVREVEVVDHLTSGDRLGYDEEVVGYAGVIFW